MAFPACVFPSSGNIALDADDGDTPGNKVLYAVSRSFGNCVHCAMLFPERLHRTVKRARLAGADSALPSDVEMSAVDYSLVGANAGEGDFGLFSGLMSTAGHLCAPGFVPEGVHREGDRTWYHVPNFGRKFFDALRKYYMLREDGSEIRVVIKRPEKDSYCTWIGIHGNPRNYSTGGKRATAASAASLAAPATTTATTTTATSTATSSTATTSSNSTSSSSSTSSSKQLQQQQQQLQISVSPPLCEENGAASACVSGGGRTRVTAGGGLTTSATGLASTGLGLELSPLAHNASSHKQRPSLQLQLQMSEMCSQSLTQMGGGGQRQTAGEFPKSPHVVQMGGEGSENYCENGGFGNFFYHTGFLCSSQRCDESPVSREVLRNKNACLKLSALPEWFPVE